MKQDNLSFDVFYRRYYDKAVAFALSYVHEKTVAEDIAVEAFVRMWRQMAVKDNRQLKALLIIVLRNLCMDWLKHERVRQKSMKSISQWERQDLEFRISSLESCEPKIILSDEVQSIISDTMDRLPETTRRIFMMSRFQGMTYQEIAGAIALSEKSVEYHIAKALRAFRVSLRDYLPVYWICLGLFTWNGTSF